MGEEEFYKWIEAFKNEHGYEPNQDPALKAKGLSEDEMWDVHLESKEWSDQYFKDFGVDPDYYIHRYSQPRRYINGQLVTGFGDYPPERDIYRQSYPQPQQQQRNQTNALNLGQVGAPQQQQRQNQNNVLPYFY